MNQNTYEWVKFGCLSGAIGLSLFLMDRLPYPDDLPEYKTFSASIPKQHVWNGQTFIPLKEKIRLCSVRPQCKKLSEALVYEARGESLIGMVAVAHVIMNRVGHKHWPNTISGVIHQSKQFEYLSNKHMQKQPKQSDWDKAKTVAFDVIHGKIGDVSGGATHYFNPNKVNPKWAKNLTYVSTIDNHVFYK